jgi:FRG domain-containing protein
LEQPAAIRWADPMVARSLRELQDQVGETQSGQDKQNYIYRGQPSGFPLTTSLERACADFGIDLSTALSLERQLLREFKRRAHHYLQHVPGEGNTIEWLALMQHHGAPSRLLDWTYSLPVATYFALVAALPATSIDDSGNARRRDAEVWMINTAWCRDTSIRLLPEDDWVLREALQSAADERRLSRFLPWDKPIACVYPVNPFRLNERLTIQRGVFLYPGDPRLPFEANLRAVDGHQEPRNLRRFTIPRENMIAVLEGLQETNISEATLFPGLDGFSRSLLRRLPFFIRQEHL